MMTVNDVMIFRARACENERSPSRRYYSLREAPREKLRPRNGVSIGLWLPTYITAT